MRSLTVAWDHTLAANDKGGTGVYAARLLEELQCRDDVTMEVLQGWYRNSSSDGLLSRRFRSVADLLWTHAYLPYSLSRRPADLLHAPAFVAPVAAPIPIVVTVHDITYLLFPSHFSKWWVRYMATVMPPVMRAAGAIICGSEHSKQDIAKAYGLPPSKVHVVSYGVDHGRFHPAVSLDRQWARSLDIREGYVLHIGTLSYRKNVPVLLRAVGELRARGKWGTRQVVLAGALTRSMKGANEVLDLIHELDLTDVVVLGGHIADQHIPGLYASASVLVMPSLYEGFGFPVLEGMAVGTPVIVSDRSSLPEIADGAAIIFPATEAHALADAMEDIFNSRSAAQELRQKGLTRAKEFTWQRTAEQTVLVYRAVTGI